MYLLLTGLQDRLAEQERGSSPHMAQEVVCADWRHALLLQDTAGGWSVFGVVEHGQG